LKEFRQSGSTRSGSCGAETPRRGEPHEKRGVRRGEEEEGELGSLGVREDAKVDVGIVG